MRTCNLVFLLVDNNEASNDGFVRLAAVVVVDVEWVVISSSKLLVILVELEMTVSVSLRRLRVVVAGGGVVMEEEVVENDDIQETSKKQNKKEKKQFGGTFGFSFLSSYVFG